jgi:hypothetical protein
MLRDLKALGLALLAVFAVSAMAASAASAQGKLTSDGPVTLTGVQLGELGSGRNATTAFNRREECPNATYTGHKVGSLNETIPSGSTEFTITPHFGLCSITTPVGAFPTTLDMNGCDYVFDLGPTVVLAGTYSVGLTIICPAGKHIQTTVFKTLTHTVANRFCTVTYTHKTTSYTGLHATNGAGGHINIVGTIKGIKVDQTTGDGGESNPVLCPTQTSEAAELHLDLTIKGNGGATPISISD